MEKCTGRFLETTRDFFPGYFRLRSASPSSMFGTVSIIFYVWHGEHLLISEHFLIGEHNLIGEHYLICEQRQCMDFLERIKSVFFYAFLSMHHRDKACIILLVQ